MNKRRINKLIKALKTEPGQNMFNMSEWFVKGQKTPRMAFKGKGDCGTMACMAGMAAIIDKDFFNIRPIRDLGGIGRFQARKNSTMPIEDFARWLNIPTDEAISLCYASTRLWINHKTNDVGHAVNLLEAYRDGGMDAALSVS